MIGDPPWREALGFFLLGVGISGACALLIEGRNLSFLEIISGGAFSMVGAVYIQCLDKWKRGDLQ